ncbi:MAG TPA: SdrD B-like domain-containing protein [Nitrospirota bacterium]|nr:SdrD B-like domain-containing protein [Nitrospirota bacterium]
MKRIMSKQTFFIILISVLMLILTSVKTSIAGLVATEHAVTATPSWETTPRLGNDGVSDLVVYTNRDLQADGTLGRGDIWYQRLDSSGAPSGPAVQVTSGPQDNQLNDISGDYIVYTAYDNCSSMSGQFMVYQISTTLVYSIGSAIVVQEVRISGNKVVWREGGANATQVMLYDLSWLGTAMDATLLAGPIPPTYYVGIGDRFVVWAEETADQLDVVAFDLTASKRINLTATPSTNEAQPSTSGAWIVWQAQDKGSAAARVIARNLDTGEERVVADGFNDHPTIDGDLIAWESLLVPTSRQIFVYRISTGETFQVTNDGVDHYLNDVFGNKVVYVDQRTGNEDIYVASLTFVPTNPANFSLGPLVPMAVSTGETNTTSVTINSINGFSSPVTLSVSSMLPDGVSAAFTPDPVTPPAGGTASSALTVSLLPLVTSGTFTMTITGTSGSLTDSTNATVTVNASTSSISSVIEELLTAGCINNEKVANGLISILSAAQKAIDAGHLQTAIFILDVDDFITGVLAHFGNGIASSCTVGGITFNPAQVLIKDVTALNDSLKVSATPNPVSGYVVDSSGLGISGIAVNIVNAAGKTVARVRTDVMGFYLFPTTRVLTTGSTYTVQVTVPAGYTTSTPAIQTLTFEGTAITLGNFVLN